MKVVNVAGFDMRFEKEGITYKVPNDGKLHIIPDRCFYEDNFQGLLRVIVPPTPVKQVVKEMVTFNKVVDINDETIKEIVIERVEEKMSKPLMGKKLKSKVREKLKKTKSEKLEQI
jgi:hypothetical protein